MDESSNGFRARAGKAARLLLNVVIVLYSLMALFYLVNGPADFLVLGKKIRLNDLFTLVFIPMMAGGIRIAMDMTWTRHRQFALAAFLMSMSLCVITGELVLRLAYPGEMSPPPYLYNNSAPYNENKRGPYFGNHKKDGVKRIMVQGDSISWGAAVPDWKDLYPFKLMDMLENGESRGRYDMQSWAQAGMQVDWHAKILDLMGDDVNPDIIIYQWYSNDVEVWADRPAAADIPWRRWKIHEPASGISILYRWIDSLMAAAIYQEGNVYAEYLRTKITPGKKYWWYYEKEFHKWAVNANSRAERVIMLIYPSLPYKGEYPFKEVTQSTLDLAKPHLLKIPAAYLDNRTGHEEPLPGATYELARVARKGTHKPGHITYGPYLAFAQGAHEARFNMKLLTPVEDPSTPVAVLDVMNGQGKMELGKRTVTAGEFESSGGWTAFSVPFNVAERIARDVEFRVEYLGGFDLAVDTINVPVDYKIEVVDPTETLKTFNTHARLFDAHPSARAHTVLAEALYRKIVEGK